MSSPPLPPLDDAPGPAVARSRRALAAMRERILARAARRGRPARGMPWPLQLAAAVALGLACAGTGLAAVRTWPALRAYFTSAQTAVPAEPQRPPPPVEPPAPSTAQLPLAAVADPSPPALNEPPAANEPKETRARSTAETRVPADWLARANQLRAQQRWRAAEALYLHGLDSATSGAARSAAAVAAADLRLNHLHQPRAALALFERALALEPHGALSAQARHGLALSYRALGDRTREAAALRAFIAEHPRSPMRPRAEQRLAELARD